VIRPSSIFVLSALFAAQAVCLRGSPPLDPSPRVLRFPKAPAVKPPLPETVERSVQRGLRFLLENQNPNGSWGSPRNTKGVNIYAPVPGAHQAFRAAVTGLCVMALCEAGEGVGGVPRALERAERYLLEHLPHVKRATPDTIYNVWAHAYGIQGLVRLYLRARSDRRKQALMGLIRGQIDMLRRYECMGGGWAYYDFEAHTRHPSGTSPSFVTAAVLVALKEAQEVGAKVPEGMVRGAIRCLLRQRKPDGSFLYGEYLWWRPMRLVNRPPGSLGRSQACNFALRIWGRPEGRNEVMTAWLNRLFARNGWLSIGRKRPIPHEAWFQVAGYFFYFGHYYAARCIEVLPARDQAFFKPHLARVLIALQERNDGSWWDFPFYDYHKQYGTAFALCALSICRAKKSR